MREGYVSIMVPIYNGEEYIPYMLESIANQTYKKIDIVLVDDGSTDLSRAICESYSSTDERFHVFKPSIKLGNAVKSQEWALDKCDGEYYFFISQDDFLDADLIEKCVKTMVNKDADAVVPNGWLYYGERNKKRIGNYPINDDYDTTIDGREAFLASLGWDIHGFAMFRTSLIKKVGIKSGYWNNDEYYTRLHYLNARRVGFCDSNMYYRKDNPDAITANFRYFHVDRLCVDYMLIKKCIEISVNRNIIVKRYLGLIKAYASWIPTMIKNRVVTANGCYIPKTLFWLFPRILMIGVKIIVLPKAKEKI